LAGRRRWRGGLLVWHVEYQQQPRHRAIERPWVNRRGVGVVYGEKQRGVAVGHRRPPVGRWRGWGVRAARWRLASSAFFAATQARNRRRRDFNSSAAAPMRALTVSGSGSESKLSMAPLQGGFSTEIFRCSYKIPTPLLRPTNEAVGIEAVTCTGNGD